MAGFVGVPCTISYATQTGSGWTIGLDTDGDAKADFAIDVKDATHAIHWDVGDFIL